MTPFFHRSDLLFVLLLAAVAFCVSYCSFSSSIRSSSISSSPYYSPVTFVTASADDSGNTAAAEAAALSTSAEVVAAASTTSSTASSTPTAATDDASTSTSSPPPAPRPNTYYVPGRSVLQQANEAEALKDTKHGIDPQIREPLGQSSPRGQYDRIIVIGDLHGDLDTAFKLLRRLNVITLQPTYYQDYILTQARRDAANAASLLNKAKDLEDGGSNDPQLTQQYLSPSMIYNKRGHIMAGSTVDQYHWALRDTLLVVLGDSMNVGPDDIGLVRLLRRLMMEASLSSSQLVFTLGNHEASNLQGDFSGVHPWSFERSGGADGRTLMLSPETPIGRFLRKRPIVFYYDGLLFMHAGLVPQAVQIVVEAASGKERKLLKNISSSSSSSSSSSFSSSDKKRTSDKDDDDDDEEHLSAEAFATIVNNHAREVLMAPDRLKDITEAESGSGGSGGGKRSKKGKRKGGRKGKSDDDSDSSSSSSSTSSVDPIAEVAVNINYKVNADAGLLLVHPLNDCPNVVEANRLLRLQAQIVGHTPHKLPRYSYCESALYAVDFKMSQWKGGLATKFAAVELLREQLLTKPSEATGFDYKWSARLVIPDPTAEEVAATRKAEGNSSSSNSSSSNRYMTSRVGPTPTSSTTASPSGSAASSTTTATTTATTTTPTTGTAAALPTNHWTVADTMSGFHNRVGVASYAVAVAVGVTLVEIVIGGLRYCGGGSAKHRARGYEPVA